MRLVDCARSTAERLPASVHFITADLCTANGCRTLAQATIEEIGQVDVLVNVLGGSTAPPGGHAALDDEAWPRELKLNLFPAVRLDRELIPATVQGGSGVEVHVTSIQREFSLPDSKSAYAAAKAGLSNLSRSLSNEVTPKGDRVVRVSPAWVETEAAVALAAR